MEVTVAVNRRVHVFETGGSSPWYADRLEKEMARKLGSHERIVGMRWPDNEHASQRVWVITEELIMGPPP